MIEKQHCLWNNSEAKKRKRKDVKTEDQYKDTSSEDEESAMTSFLDDWDDCFSVHILTK